MRRLFTAIVALALIGVVGLVGFTIFSELPAPTREIVLPVETR